MHKRFILIAGICLSFALTSLVSAQTTTTTTTQPGTKTPGINKRQKSQAKRVRHGVKNKSLTKHETRTLAKDAKGIQQAKTTAKSDGTVTGDERKAIHKEMNQESRKIYRKKHNSRTRK